MPGPNSKLQELAASWRRPDLLSWPSVELLLMADAGSRAMIDRTGVKLPDRRNLKMKTSASFPVLGIYEKSVAAARDGYIEQQIHVEEGLSIAAPLTVHVCSSAPSRQSPRRLRGAC